MTQTTHATKPFLGAASGSDAPLHPDTILMNLIVNMLSPIFLPAAGGDIARARIAAFGMVNAYQVRQHADLIAVAQLVAYGLMGIAAACLSLTEDISPAMMLRLGRHVGSMNRCAEQNRRWLRETGGVDRMRLDGATRDEPRAAFPPEDVEVSADDALPMSGIPDEETGAGTSSRGTAPAVWAEFDAEPLMSPEAARMLEAEADARLMGGEQVAVGKPVAVRAVPAPARSVAAFPAPTGPISSKRESEMWATVMLKQADEITAGLPKLPPAERRAAEIKAASLTSAANTILSGGGRNSQSLKASLTGNTAIGLGGF